MSSLAVSSRDKKGQSLTSYISDYTVIDIETTGLSTMFNEIIEIAAIKVRDNKPIGEFCTFVKPSTPISEFITSLTNITNEMVANAPKIDEVLPAFIEFLGDDIIVAHNANFDINFIYDVLEYYSQGELTNDFIDTLRVARHKLPHLARRRLCDLIEYFKIETHALHRALHDCRATMLIYEGLKACAEPIPKEKPKKKYKRNHHHNPAKTINDSYAKTVDCSSFELCGSVFVFTGALASISRLEAMKLVVDLGGAVSDAFTKKTTHLVVADEIISTKKSSKLVKAEKYKEQGVNLEILSESDFFDLIKS